MEVNREKNRRTLSPWDAFSPVQEDCRFPEVFPTTNLFSFTGMSPGVFHPLSCPHINTGGGSRTSRAERPNLVKSALRRMESSFLLYTCINVCVRKFSCMGLLRGWWKISRKPEDFRCSFVRCG